MAITHESGIENAAPSGRNGSNRISDTPNNNTTMNRIAFTEEVKGDENTAPVIEPQDTVPVSEIEENKTADSLIPEPDLMDPSAGEIESQIPVASPPQSDAEVDGFWEKIYAGAVVYSQRRQVHALCKVE